jgi:hypothetical protein
MIGNVWRTELLSKLCRADREPGPASDSTGNNGNHD